MSADELPDAALERMEARNPRINAIRATWPDQARDEIAAVSRPGRSPVYRFSSRTWALQ